MPTNWSEKSVAVLHSLFIFTPSMRPPWQQLVFASWADASDRLRPDGSRTGGYVITLATEELFGHGQEDDVSVMSWRSFKLPRKIDGSNNGEPQALAFADESLWLVRLAWSEMHGVLMRRWHLDETVRQLGGMLITYSRVFFFLMPSREANHHSFDCEALEQVKSTWYQGTVCRLRCSHSLGQYFNDAGRQSD